eukprot:1362729-Rhodomonas_salina.1
MTFGKCNGLLSVLNRLLLDSAEVRCGRIKGLERARQAEGSGVWVGACSNGCSSSQLRCCGA